MTAFYSLPQDAIDRGKNRYIRSFQGNFQPNYLSHLEKMPPLSIPDRQAILAQSILSASGWRKIFAKDENDVSSKLNKKDAAMLCSAFATILSFFHPFSQVDGGKKLLVARDSRPTGTDIEALFFAIALNAEKPSPKRSPLDTNIPCIALASLGVTSLPQTLADVQCRSDCCGFIYFTASHNPAGYNGIKLGLSDGKVLDMAIADKLRQQFLKRFLSETHLADVAFANSAITKYNKHPFSNTPFSKTMREIANTQVHEFNHSCTSYENLMLYILSGYTPSQAGNSLKASDFPKSSSPLENANAHIQRFTKLTQQKKACVMLDYNGSSRIRSADLRLLSKLKVAVSTSNDTIGVFAHGITPEGQALSYLKEAMDTSSPADTPTNQLASTAFLGMTFDCDGDRGNLVVKQSDGKSLVLGAQSSFAIALIAQLSFLKLNFPQLKRIAIVANDATSLSFETIAECFSVNAFRGEVGEANILALQKEKIEAGFFVPIVGEGSNGGNIVSPHTVRDPMVTLLSVLRLLLDDDIYHTAIEALQKRKNTAQNTNDKNNKADKGGIPVKRLELLSRLLAKYHCTQVFDSAALLPAKFLKNVRIFDLKQDFVHFLNTTGISQLENLINTIVGSPTMAGVESKKQVGKIKVSIAITHNFGTKTYSELDPLHASHAGGGSTVLIAIRQPLQSTEFKNAPRLDHRNADAMLWFRRSATEPVIRLSAEVFAGDRLKAAAVPSTSSATNDLTKLSEALRIALLSWLRNTLTDILKARVATPK